MGAHGKTSPPHSSGSTAAKRASSASSDALSSALRLVKSGGSGSRYLWTDDPEKSRCLISIVTMALAKKPTGARRNIRSGEWAQLLETFNTEAPEPVDCIKVLQNRLVTLRTNCREYHEVATAKDVEALLEEKPALRKWQRKRFEFYEEMAGCMKLMGDRLVGEVRGDDDKSKSDREEEEEEEEEEEDVALEKSGASESEGEEVEVPAKAKRGREEDDAAPRRQSGGHDAASDTSTSSHASSQHKRARRESGTHQDAAAPSTNAELSLYATAVEQLGALQLPLPGRVDAKRFLVDARNAQAFVYMDEAEQRYFLAKYSHHERAGMAPGVGQ